MAAQELPYNPGSPAWCAVTAWRGEGREGGDTCVIMADLVIVRQIPTQHCKAIFLQLRNKQIKNQVVRGKKKWKERRKERAKKNSV